ncbi:MAG TPA: MBL fold metallo-hydrolase [Candidatus Limnocylindrales bacterium]|nr:MBL fold metallo-hydrolase [Candidatus Limnocylindrales bacterium]
MEITWYGGGCVRLRGREGTIAADAYRSIVGPTGRGLTADIVTYSHADPEPLPVRGRAKGGAKRSAADGNGRAALPPTSLESAFLLDGPGEYEVHDVLITGVRTFRDEQQGRERGDNVAFVFELDGLHVAHLGDLGHPLTEEMLGELGSVDVLCLPIAGNLNAARLAQVAARVDANLIVPLAVSDDEAHVRAEMGRFLHEMGVQDPAAQPKLTVTPSSVPQETTLVLLESRAKV